MLTFALSALFSLALVLVMAELLQARHRDLVRWISVLVVVGYSVVALHFFSFQSEAVRTAGKFVDQAGSYGGYGLYLSPTAPGEMLVAPFPPAFAARAGFEKGDVLTAVNGQAIPPGGSLQEVLDRFVGDGSDVTVSLQGADGAQREVVLDSKLRTYWNLEVQQAINAIGAPALDRTLTFGFGLVGLWLIVVNWLARRLDGFPRLLPYVGIGAGLASWLFAASNQFDVEALSWVGLLGGLVLLPAWLVWTGLVLPKLR